MIFKYEESKATVEITVEKSDALHIRAKSESGMINLAVYCGEIALYDGLYYHGGKTIQAVHAWMVDICRGVEDHPAADFVMRLVRHEIEKYEKEVK